MKAIDTDEFIFKGYTLNAVYSVWHVSVNESVKNFDAIERNIFWGWEFEEVSGKSILKL